MQGLCVLNELDSQTWAAWAQAIFSGVAIGAAFWIGHRQAAAQHESAMRVLKEQNQRSDLASLRTLAGLAKGCARLAMHAHHQLSSREAVSLMALGEVHFDRDEYARMDTAVQAIPLHALSEEGVTYALIVSSTMRQLRAKVDGAFRHFRTMDDAAYADLFRTLFEMREGLESTEQFIRKEVDKAAAGLATAY